MNFPSHYLKASIATDELWLEAETMIAGCVLILFVAMLSRDVFFWV